MLYFYIKYWLKLKIFIKLEYVVYMVIEFFERNGIKGRRKKCIFFGRFCEYLFWIEFFFLGVFKF